MLGHSHMSSSEMFVLLAHVVKFVYGLVKNG